MTNAIDPAEADLRAAARKRLEARQNAWRFAAVWVVLSVFFVVIWALTGAGYFWPFWPIVGIGIGVAFSFLGAYAGRGISESRVDAEVERMRARR